MKLDKLKIHSLYIAIKFPVYLAIITILFTLVSGKEIGISFSSALVLSILSYIGVDLFMLPIMGNFFATSGDLILNGLFFYLVSYVFQLGLPFLIILMTALLTTIFEYYYHKFLTKKFDFHWEV
jgi:hypothetical protein